MKYIIAPLLFLLLHNTLIAQRSNNNATIGMTISLPFFNNYRYYEYVSNSSVTQSGLMGLGFALFYKHNRIKYSLNGASTILFNGNTFAKGDGSEDIAVKYLEGLVHYTFYKKMNVIGGVNLSNYHYEASSIMPDNSFFINKNDLTIGFTTGIEYMFSKTFSLAAYYRPSLYSDGVKSYKRTLSLDARFDIKFLIHNF